MSNVLVASIYIPFAIVTLIILVEVLLRNIRHRGNYLFMLLCILVICWYASDIAGLLTNSKDTAKFLWSFLLIFIGFIPPVLLLFVLDFYRVNLKREAKFIPLIFVIPSINTTMALTSGYHSLMYTQLDIVSLSPVHEVVRVWGSWFWVHTAHSYIISIAIISVILLKHFRMPRFYRLPSTLMVAGISITLVGNIITLLQLLPAALDPTLIGTSLALILFNFAIISNERSKFVRYSIGKVFNHLGLYIVVMDESDCVVHANRPAHDWFSSLGIALDSLNLSGIMELLISKGGTQRDSENEKGIDIYFPADPLPVVLNIHKQKMIDKNGDHIGSVAIFTDVTQNRQLLSRLEEKAGMDSLTGLANRMAYEGARKRLDVPEHLPLSIIMCDVNGLKAVNDNLGHLYGDMMLQAVAEILETACPGPGFVARIGGDEFVCLLSCTSEEAASAFMEKIKEMMSNRKNLPFTLSAALGTATKLSADEDINDVSALADNRMYENKKWIKSQ